MRLRWFGPTWDAPVNDREMRVESPLGEFCLGCNKTIVEGERGLLMGCDPRVDGSFAFWIDGDSVSVCAIHIDCHLEAILGPDHDYFAGTIDRTAP